MSSMYLSKKWIIYDKYQEKCIIQILMCTNSFLVAVHKLPDALDLQELHAVWILEFLYSKDEVYF